MKRLLLVTMFVFSINSLFGPVQAQAEGRWHGRCTGWQMGEQLTPAIWASKPDASKRKIQRLIACEFAIWAPGQSLIALYVANRESHFYPWAQNPSSLCSGIFQHAYSAWPSRALSYLKHWEYSDWPAPWSDPRANIEVAAKMVGPEGNWGPWSL